MTGAVLIAVAVAVAILAALSLRLGSALSTLLAGYLALVANVALVTWALSPFHAVTRTGLAVSEGMLLVLAVVAWWVRGRPGVSLGRAREAWDEVRGDPLTLVILALLGAALAYELMLALVVPPNNYDSLTYHLSRVAAWNQDHGIRWIANAPSDRLNEFQPLAEQQILFLVVAVGTGALFALPQFLAQLAILAAVYGASRRLGFDRRISACSAALLGTFSLFALQATTAQNDLVAAAFPIVAACLLLSTVPLEALLAGVALGMGVGAKLTTVLVWPVIAALVWVSSRTNLRRVGVGIALGLGLVGIWSFVLNLLHTGSPLGHGGGRTDQSVSPSFVTMSHTFVRIVYRLLDLALLRDWEIWTLAGAGVVAGLLVLLSARRGTDARGRILAALVVAVPLAVPFLILGVAPLLAWCARLIGLPVTDPIYGFTLNRTVSEDFSGFGPAAVFALLGAPLVVLVAARADRRRVALALTLPSYLILLGLYARYNIWITRFLIVPAALSAPLFGHLMRSRAAIAALLSVGLLTVGYTLAEDINKPFNGGVAHPWNLSQRQALEESPAEPMGREVSAALGDYQRLVPPTACVGAVLDPDEWSYPLWGPRLQHRVLFLPSLNAERNALADHLHYVVVSTGANAPVADQFSGAGWKILPLGRWWNLAIAPTPATSCSG